MKHRIVKTAKAVLLFVVAFLLFALSPAPRSFATNGMNMEGYGPIAAGMGGASMAYDNGAAAVMNNPATLGLMAEGNRLDAAVGLLGPDITTYVQGGPSAESSADLFIMPAAGWIRKSGNYAYGAGVFCQGGMGTEYAADSFLAMGSGDKVRSELGVGRFIVPFVYSVSPELNIGASLDYVWAYLDLQMAAQVGDLAGLITNCTGPLCAGLGGLPATNWARIDFSSGGEMNGAAQGAGVAGKIGLTYKIGSAVTLGAVYQSGTSLSDLETETAGAFLTAQGAGPAVPGKITIVDFQWPAIYAVGAAWNATDEFMVVADVRRIGWKSVMKDFRMIYEGGGSTIDIAMPQNWEDQTVFGIGAARRITDALTFRFGFNLADNPVPDEFLNYLFPAIEKDHYTVGLGYVFLEASSIDVSLAYAPEVKIDAGSGLTTTHSQMNSQIMYSYRF